MSYHVQSSINACSNAATSSKQVTTSFPTLRSSDLNGPNPVERRPDAAEDLHRIRENPMSHQDRHRDRKSTRLNSSHRCITYAVFCLKKNNKSKTQRSYEHEISQYQSKHCYTSENRN